MDKQAELLQKLGFDLAEIEKDEFSIEDAISSFNDKQIEILKNRADIFEPVKAEAKKEANIVATKKIKKIINEFFGLGISDKDIQEKDVLELLDSGTSSLKSGSSEEVSKLQEKLIEANNRITRIEEEKNAEIQSKISEYEGKYKNEKISHKIKDLVLNGTEYIAPNEDALDMFFVKSQKEGVVFDIDEKDNVIIKTKDGYNLLTDDQSKKADLEYLKNKYVGGLIKKSNGTQQQQLTQQQQAKSIYPDNLPPHMLEAQKILSELEKVSI